MTGMVVVTVGLSGWKQRGFHVGKRETRAFWLVAFGDPPNSYPYFSA